MYNVFVDIFQERSPNSTKLDSYFITESQQVKWSVSYLYGINTKIMSLSEACTCSFVSETQYTRTVFNSAVVGR